MSREESVQHFLDLIKKSRRGKFKVYIGMIAGVGKTYRMLQEAHDLLDNGVDVNIGYVETHGRAGTEAVLAGLPVIPRRKIFYKGKELEEMDLDAIIRIHPEIVIVDELAHTNVEGSRNEKRWQDVMDLLDEGINVISAVNIQHIESINEEVQGISGIEVKERIPDSVLEEADEVVNIDLTAEELITRLKAGKIYKPDKVALALNNFFKTENILQLRELALKEVALRKWRMKWWFPVWACGMRSSWRVSAVMRKRHAALSARRHDWQPVIIRRSLPFMYRLPGRVPTALPLQTSGIC
jgi:two-component system sensor histidine kinase KdpD